MERRRGRSRSTTVQDIVSKSGFAEVAVSRDYYSEGEVSVTLTLNGITATAGEDFAADPVTLTWGDGEIGWKSVLVDIPDDAEQEDRETFRVEISRIQRGVRSSAQFPMARSRSPPATHRRCRRPEAEAGARPDSCRCCCSALRNSSALSADRPIGAPESGHGLSIRTPKRKQKAPDGDVGGDRPKLRLAEYSAPFGEEMPHRTATSDLPDFAEAWREFRRERGRLH